MNQFTDFIAQIQSLPDLVKEQAREIDGRMRLLLTAPEIYGIRQVIILGSGDSYFAAQAVAPAIRAWTGLPVNALLAMEAARYVDAGRPPLAGRNRGLLVISISSSGEAARVVEATQRMRQLGALTVAITANPESRLGKAAERILEIGIPSAPPAPGTRSYVASLLAVYSIGIRLAEMLMTMTMDEANALRSEIVGLSDAIRQTCSITESGLSGLAAEWSKFGRADVLGSGPALGTAGYSAAKLVEAAGVHAVAQDSEEFHHLNYFVSEPAGTPTIVYAPSASIPASRSGELIGTLKGLGRPTLLITDGDDLPNYGHRLNLPTVCEWFSPLIHVVPAAWLSAEWAQALNIVHYRGHTGPWSGAVGAGLVRNSTILLSN